MLTVDIEQLFTQCAQLLRRGRAAVDPGAALAMLVYRTAQQQAFAGIEAGGSNT